MRLAAFGVVSVFGVASFTFMFETCCLILVMVSVASRAWDKFR